PVMSALGQKQTCAVNTLMSALPPIATTKADINRPGNRRGVNRRGGLAPAHASRGNRKGSAAEREGEPRMVASVQHPRLWSRPAAPVRSKATQFRRGHVVGFGDNP